MNKPKVLHFEKNLVGNDYVVGDIHGCFTKLETELYTLGFNPELDRLFSVGDLTDRGSESEKCLEWLEKPWFHSVKGNHEQMLIDAFYEGELYNLIGNGGSWYLDLDDQEKEYYATRFNQLPIALEIETDRGLIGVIHAECPDTSWDKFKQTDLDRGTEAYCLWSRVRIGKMDNSNIVGLYKLYVGHTPVKEVTELGNVVYIDTGAVFKQGRMTILKIN